MKLLLDSHALIWSADNPAKIPAVAMTAMQFHHRDPFDRMLAAQALLDGMRLVGADAIFDAYGVPRVWS